MLTYPVSLTLKLHSETLWLSDDSVDQDQTAHKVHSGLWSTLTEERKEVLEKKRFEIESLEFFLSG